MNQSNGSLIKYFPCPNCGAKVSFNPEVAQLKCEYCGWEDAIPDSGEKIEEQSYQQYLNQSNKRLATLSEIALEVTCNNCGATVEFEPPKMAGECAFCGSHIVASPTSADPTICLLYTSDAADD